MSFPDFLRAEVLRLGGGVSRTGEEIAATALGVTSRTVRVWMYGERTPKPLEEAGVRALLPGVKARPRKTRPS